MCTRLTPDSTKRAMLKLRLSPNEEAQLIREEYDRRRKLRVQQVREQERCNALQIRREVQRRQEQELHTLAEQLREAWERGQKERIETLQRVYQESLQSMGQGHRSAKENEPDWEAIAQREEDNRIKAEERYQAALKDLHSQRQKDTEERTRSTKARTKALQAEKERSAAVASLPPPPLHPMENLEPRKPPTVRKTDLNAFSATHYHMLLSAVERELDTVQPNACERAELELARRQELERQAHREKEEQGEKASLRGKYALRRERLIQDQERFIVELEHMQQTDLLRRRQQVSQMPAQIFQPLYKRQKMREDNQREMEFAFEDMYTGERRVKGNLVLQLVPEPLPAPSTGSQDQELDVTMEDITTTPLETTPVPGEPHDHGQQGQNAEQATATQAPHRRALTKLLKRIRSQRAQWRPPAAVGECAAEPQPQPEPQPTQCMAEQDTTVDTGSLTSEERDRCEQPEAPVLEESVIDTGTIPDVLPNNIHRFEQEQKRRAEELEREKQQQIALLEDLEEQRCRLEQMLLESQLERANLQTAVAQEAPAQGQAVAQEVPAQGQAVAQEVPAQGQAVAQDAHGVAPQAVPPPDDHARRIREYQQRLLEQNRRHQRAVEVGRQRLEEYQRVLQHRYSMKPAHTTLHALTPCSTLPGHAVTLPVHLHASLGRARHLHSARLTNGRMERVPELLPERPKPSPVVTLAQSHRPFPPGPSTPDYQDPAKPPSALGLESLNAGTVWQRFPTQGQEVQEAASGCLAARQVKVPSVSEQRERRSLVTHQHYLSSFTSTTPLPSASSVTEQALLMPGTFPCSFVPLGPQASREGSVDTRRQELVEAPRQPLEQQEHGEKEQSHTPEDKKQGEALSALVSAGTHPSTESVGVSVSENSSETRRRWLSSLLKAIEESNRGTLTHLGHQEQENTLGPQTSSSSEMHSTYDDLSCQSSVADKWLDLHLPARAPKPPITRVKMGLTDVAGFHELSTIQEVETPVDTILGPAPPGLSTSSFLSVRGATNFPGPTVCCRSPTDVRSRQHCFQCYPLRFTTVWINDDN